MSFLEKGSYSGKLEVELSISDLEIAEMLARKEVQGNNTISECRLCARSYTRQCIHVGSFISYNWDALIFYNFLHLEIET